MIEQICKKLRKGKDVATIADEVEEDVARVQAICNIASAYGPEYNVHDVMAAVFQEA